MSFLGLFLLINFSSCGPFFLLCLCGDYLLDIDHCTSLSAEFCWIPLKNVGFRLDVTLTGLYPASHIIKGLCFLAGGNELLPALWEHQELFGLFAFFCLPVHVHRTRLKGIPPQISWVSFPVFCLALLAPRIHRTLISLLFSVRTLDSVWVPPPTTTILQPRNHLQAVGWGSHQVHLVCFPSLRDHRPVLPTVQSLKIISYSV